MLMKLTTVPLCALSKSDKQRHSTKTRKSGIHHRIYNDTKANLAMHCTNYIFLPDTESVDRVPASS